MSALATQAAAGRRTGLPGAVQLRIFLRSLGLQAGWNFERMQNLGFLWAVSPWLERVWTEPQELRRAQQRHLEFFNTTPQMAGFALGAVCAMEEDLAGLKGAEREKAEQRLVQVKRLLGSALAALGDALFWGTMRPFCAALALAILVAAVEAGARAPWAWAVGVYLAVYNGLSLWIRWKGIGLGYSWGDAFPAELQRLAPQRLARGLKTVGLGLAAFAAIAFLSRSSRVALGAGFFGFFLCLKLLRLPNRTIYAGLIAGALVWHGARALLG